jgi:hypothetical protein
MSRGLALGSTLVHLVCVMIVAWVTGYCCDKGMPRMIASGVVYIVAGGLHSAALHYTFGTGYFFFQN